MADNTKIEWADATVNYVNGCSVVSPGCTNCYAMRLAGTRLKHDPSRKGLTIDSKAGPVWNGKVRDHEPALLQPLRWKRGRRLFWNAHGDLFHENVPGHWIDRQFAVMALTPQHTHMVLTKRPARMRDYLSRPGVQVRIGLEALGLVMEATARTGRSTLGAGILIKGSDINPGALVNWPLPNVWLGTSVEDQARADERIPELLATPAAVRFLSCEPLLGPVDLRELPMRLGGRGYGLINGLRGTYRPNGHPEVSEPVCPKIDQVIVGGESGPGSRPMHPDWARSLRDQCAAAGVAFFFKQWGDWFPVDQYEHSKWGAVVKDIHCFADGSKAWKFGKKRAGRLLDRLEHNGVPA